jgi:hypothetical protein
MIFTIVYNITDQKYYFIIIITTLLIIITKQTKVKILSVYSEVVKYMGVSIRQ